MNINDVMKDLIQNKSGTLIDDPNYQTAIKTNYLLQRWISMFSEDNSSILAETTNKLWNGLDDDSRMWYMLLTKIIPSNKYYKTVYFKKSKSDNIDNIDDVVKLLSDRYELSERDIRIYIEDFDVDVEKYRKLIEKGSKGEN